MKCTEFDDYLSEGIGQELGTAEQAAFDAHRASCPVCQAEYASELSLVEMLRAMPVAEAPEGFADRVLANAIKQNISQNKTQQPQQPNQQRQGFMVGFGTAAAAALAVWVVVGMSPNELPGTTNAPETVVASVATESAKNVNVETKQPVLSIVLNAQQTIKLAFASNESLKGAKITIRLPENVALVGYPGRRQLSWETNLKKGDNLLSLPVIATQIARGELIADIEYAGNVKTLRLNLETSAAETSSQNAEIKPFVG